MKIIEKMKIIESTKGERRLLFVEIGEEEYTCEAAGVIILFKLSQATEERVAGLVRKTNFGIPNPKIKWCNYFSNRQSLVHEYNLSSAIESFDSLLVAEGVRLRATAMPTVFHTDLEYNAYVEKTERYNKKEWLVLEMKNIKK